MSTTITYKGSTLATVSNNTKTLKTAGKYMEGDVMLTDSSLAPPTIQSLSITPSESTQTFNASGVDGYKPVSVSAVSSTYVGSGITQRSSTDLTASGATVTAPAGYYAEAASKSVTTMTLPTSAAASATSGYTSKATISRSTSDQYINIAPGYNSAGGYYKISAVANGSATPAASISGTSATITTGTNTITLTKTVSNTPQVSAGYVSSGTAGNSSVSLTASVTVNPTPTASGATVTIPAGYYSSQTTKSVTTMTLPWQFSSTGTGTQVTSVWPEETTRYINISSGYNETAGYYQIVGLTLDSLSVTENGTYNVADDERGLDGYKTVVVSIPSITPTIQSLSITPSTSEQTFNSSSVDGYKPVTVAAMPTMTLPTSAASSATSGYTSKATISRSTSAQYINIPPGYNSTGAYYVISATPNGTASAPTSISGTSATVSTGTNTLTFTKTVSVTPVVSAGYVSSGTATNSSVTLTASVTTKAAATITPGTSDQTIASGTYLTGAQTIKGDANLVAAKIVYPNTIFGVTGTTKVPIISQDSTTHVLSIS